MIPLEKWDALADDPAAEGARMLDPVVLAFDTTPDRSMTSIVACGSRADGLPQIEVVDRRPGTGWVAERLLELVERHQVENVLADAAGPAGSVLHQADRAGRQRGGGLGARPREGVRADVRHRRREGPAPSGRLELRQAVKGATKRPLGDAWAWSRRNTTVDISPLVAATLALWGHSNAAGEGDWTFYY